MTLSFPNNVRIATSLNYNLWRIVNLISSGELDIALVCKQTSKRNIQDLLKFVLPGGDTFLHFLIESNDKFDKLYKIINKKNLTLSLVPNYKGVTALHICVKESMIMTASKILNILSTKPLDDHSRFIKDLLTDLLRLCPISLAEYLD